MKEAAGPCDPAAWVVRTWRLQGAVLPRTGDREGDPRRLDVDEEPLAIPAVGRPRPFAAAEIAREAVLLAGQLDVVPRELEDLAVQGQALQALAREVAILAQDDPAARAHGDVVGIVEDILVGRLEDERQL